MNEVRTTTLAIGASLIGSLLSIVLEKPDILSSIILAMGGMFLLHGTGFLQEYMVRGILRWYRTKKPVIGIINDLPWQGSWGWAWSEMKPDEWNSKINSELKKNRINVKAKLIKIAKPWTRWFLDRYLIIINPYGSVYPEIDIENLEIMRSLLNYVHNGGMFVNVADIPFFFPYDIERQIIYCPTRTEPVHLYKELLRHLHQWSQGDQDFKRPHPSMDSHFSRAIMIDIVSTTKEKDKKSISLHTSLKLKNIEDSIENITIRRGILCSNHVESIVEELEWERMRFIPLCYVHFGKGKFLFSLIFLNEQTEDIKEKITNLQCDMVIKEVRGILRN